MMMEAKVNQGYDGDDSLKEYSTEDLQTLIKNQEQSIQQVKDKIAGMEEFMEQIQTWLKICDMQMDSINEQIVQLDDANACVFLNLLNCLRMFHDTMHFWMDQVDSAQYSIQMSSFEQESSVEEDINEQEFLGLQIFYNAVSTHLQSCNKMVQYWSSQISKVEAICIDINPEIQQYLENLKSTYEAQQDYMQKLQCVEQELNNTNDILQSDMKLLQMYEKELQSRKDV